MKGSLFGLSLGVKRRRMGMLKKGKGMGLINRVGVRVVRDKIKVKIKGRVKIKRIRKVRKRMMIIILGFMGKKIKRRIKNLKIVKNLKKVIKNLRIVINQKIVINLKTVI